jgi:hypothetical protein
VNHEIRFRVFRVYHLDITFLRLSVEDPLANRPNPPTAQPKNIIFLLYLYYNCKPYYTLPLYSIFDNLTATCPFKTNSAAIIHKVVLLLPLPRNQNPLLERHLLLVPC